MSHQENGSAGIGRAAEKSGKSASALSEQQRLWVREIAETIRQRRREGKLRPQREQGGALGDSGAPAVGGIS